MSDARPRRSRNDTKACDSPIRSASQALFDCYVDVGYRISEGLLPVYCLNCRLKKKMSR